MGNHHRRRRTYEIRSQNGRITYLTTEVPPTEWTERYTDRAFKAASQSPLNSWSRRVHTTPPHLLKKGFTVNLFESQQPFQYVAQRPYVPRQHVIHAPPPCLVATRSHSHSRERGRLSAPVAPPAQNLSAGLFPCLRRSFSRSRSRERQRTIYFFGKHDPYYGFTNFSKYAVCYEGKLYYTGEHLYQSLKVCRKT